MCQTNINQIGSMKDGIIMNHDEQNADLNERRINLLICSLFPLIHFCIQLKSVFF